MYINRILHGRGCKTGLSNPGGGGAVEDGVDSSAEQCSKYHNSVNMMTLYITVTAQTHKHLEENVNEE